LEFSKKASIKQMLFLSKQNSLIAHALGGFDTVRRLLANSMACECRTTWHAGLFSVDDLFALAGVRVTAQGCEQPPASIAQMSGIIGSRRPQRWIGPGALGAGKGAVTIANRVSVAAEEGSECTREPWVAAIKFTSMSVTA